MKRVNLTRVCLRSLLLTVLVTSLFSTGLASAASESSRSTQTIEGLSSNAFTDRSEGLDRAQVEVMSELLVSGVREAPDDKPPVSLKSLSAHAIQLYRIFDAKSELSWDDDGDGYYHRLRVTFDADVDFGDAFVYAKLYLSYEGGPWNHYFTTDVFHILEDASYDDYEVTTRLLDGYPSGYYEVLIELYDADWDEYVASYGPDEDTALRDLPLEDQEWDFAGDGDYTSSQSSGGGGSLGLMGLLLLTVWRGYIFRRKMKRL